MINSGKELKDNAKTLLDMKITNDQSIHIMQRPRSSSEGDGAASSSARNQRSLSGLEAFRAEYEGESMFPHNILAREANFGRLFQVLDILPDSLVTSLFDLLMLLPTNSSLMRRIEQIPDGADVEYWQSIFSTSSLLRLLYSLQIAFSLVQSHSPIGLSSVWIDDDSNKPVKFTSSPTSTAHRTAAKQYSSSSSGPTLDRPVFVWINDD